MQNSEILDYLKLKSQIKFVFNKKFFSSLDNIQNNTIFFCKNLNNINIKKINSLKHGVLIINKKSKKLKKILFKYKIKTLKSFFLKLLKNFTSKKVKI